MNEPSFPITPPDMLPPLDKPKTPILGIASFVAAIIEMLSVCAFFIFAYYLGNQAQIGNTSTVQSISVVGWVFICLTAIASMAGIGLGIAAVVQKNTSKVLGIVGLVFSILTLLGFCVLVALALGMASSMGSI